MKKTHHETVVKKLTMLGATLALLLGLPFAFANRAFAAPTPKFAYVLNGCASKKCSTGNVAVYTINASSGALTLVPGTPVTTGKDPFSVIVDPSGRFAYVANVSDNTVSAYTINSSTGALSTVGGSPFKAGVNPISVTVDPSGRFAYVANEGGNVSAFTIDSSTGALSAVAGSPFAAGEDANSVTVDPTGRFVYVANFIGDTVSAYTINSSTGALKAVPGSPFSAGFSPGSVTVDPSGRFVYTANFGDFTVSAYTINSSTGALHAVAGSPFDAGIGPSSVTVDPSGNFVYVANYGGDTVSAYTINSSTGGLREIAGSPFAAGVQADAVTVDPSGRFAYVANRCFCAPGNGTVSAYTITASTGALHAVAGSPFAAGIEPVSMAIVGQAVTASVLTLTPRSLAFGNLPIHTSSAAQSVTVTNTSAKTVAITGIALRGTNPGQFTFTDDCGKSLAAYRTCTLEAIFSPTTKGAKNAFLDVNGGGGGRSVKLTGTGT